MFRFHIPDDGKYHAIAITVNKNAVSTYQNGALLSRIRAYDMPLNESALRWLSLTKREQLQRRAMWHRRGGIGLSEIESALQGYYPEYLLFSKHGGRYWVFACDSFDPMGGYHKNMILQEQTIATADFQKLRTKLKDIGYIELNGGGDNDNPSFVRQNAMKAAMKMMNEMDWEELLK